MKKINFLAILLGSLISAQTTFTLVKDIYPGSLNSSPANLTVANGKLYFAAGSTVNGTSIGNELWESDGTETGTKLVADILQGISSSSPSNLFSFNNKIYFTANSIINGLNVAGLLFSYDSENGVKTVSTLAKFATNFTKVGNRVYFKATNTSVSPNTQRLFYLNESGDPIIADDNLNVNTIGFVGGKILANAQLTNAENVFWTQLFGYDGTTTSLIKNVNPSASAYPQNFYYSVALGKTFFNANGGSGAEPWITDGTEQGTYILKDINVMNGSAGSGPANFTECNGKIYFSASNGIESGIELWVTDGTELGTKMLRDIIPGTAGSLPEKFVVYKDKVYFLITNTGNVRQLWESDGTESGTRLLSSLASASNLISYNNNLYLSGRISNTDTVGSELYKVNLSDASLFIRDVSKVKINVFPNPSKGEINVTQITRGSFEIYDITGTIIKSGTFSNGKIPTSNKPGNYVLKIMSEDKKLTSSAKIIIQ